MFTFWRYHQHDIDKNSEEVDCEPDSPLMESLSSSLLLSSLDITSMDSDHEEQSNVVSVGTILSEEQKCGLTQLPAEVTLLIASELDASDLVDLSYTCSHFYKFITNNARSLARFDMSCLEFRSNIELKKLCMNLLCPVRGTSTFC